MMLASAVVAGLLSHWIDAAVLFAAVVVNAIIGFIQEGKAEEALDAIRNLLSLRTTVFRQGNEPRSRPRSWCQATSLPSPRAIRSP
jgi:magnesium-transporting ATPase (P-type)